MTQKTKRSLIPPRLREIYRGWVSTKPHFDAACDELGVKANSYAELFHIDANRKGLLRPHEVDKKVAIIDQLPLSKWINEQEEKGEM